MTELSINALEGINRLRSTLFEDVELNTDSQNAFQKVKLAAISPIF